MENTKTFLDFALKTALKAGKIVMKDFGKEIKVEAKGIRDIVTKYDRASEKFIKNEIKKRFPDHEFLGEEGGLTKKSKSQYMWLVDPIDGTKNFARKIPMFAISIALYKNGKPLVGVVYNPCLDDLFWAEKGKGAYRKTPYLPKPTKIHVSKTKRLIDAILATGFHPQDTLRNLPIFSRLTKETFATRRTGSAALDTCFVAAGLFDGFWEFHLKPWDVAAGILILEEAGGKVSNFDGDKVFAFDSTKLDFKLETFLASNRLLHKTLIKEIQAVLKDSLNSRTGRK